MTKLPEILSRKAIVQTFDKISPTTWEKLFERESMNGISKLRTNGDYPGRTYYKTDGLIQWMIRNGHYTLDQIERKTTLYQTSAMSVRTHLMAG